MNIRILKDKIYEKLSSVATFITNPKRMKTLASGTFPESRKEGGTEVHPISTMTDCVEIME